MSPLVCCWTKMLSITAGVAVQFNLVLNYTSVYHCSYVLEGTEYKYIDNIAWEVVGD